MTEAPSELWVVFGKDGRAKAAGDNSLETINLFRLSVNAPMSWEDYETEGWQCVKYTRSE